MAIRLPTVDDLHEAAAANHLKLTDEELEAFQAILPGLFGAYEALERMPDPHFPIKYRDRDPGYRPSREEDPFNAIVRRCTVKGAPSGKLAGKRVGLKNNVCIAGMPMMCGSMVMNGYVPEMDATIVERLLDEGAEIVATLNLDNLAWSGAGDTSAHGPILNPHNLEHLAGGSSGGSAAALYYDDIDITIGADQGGSIRIPSSWCGVVGLKPTHSLVPYTNIAGMDATIDHAGPMARTVADAALALEVIAGKDPTDPRQYDVPVQPYTEVMKQGIGGVRIGIVEEGFGWPGSEPDVETAVNKALSLLGEMGADVARVSVPAHRDASAVAWGVGVEGASAVAWGVGVEGATAYFRSNGMGHHWQGLYNPGMVESMGKSLRAQGNDLPPTIKLVLLIGTYVSERYHGRMYARAQNLRQGLRAAYDRALEQVDVLAMPTTPVKAHRYEPDSGVEALLSHGWNMFQNTATFDVTGHPALNVPCGKSDGLPIGLMLVGKHFDDGTLFRVAHAFEQQADWETL